MGNYLSELQRDEPLPKEKYESEYKIWFFRCQECIEELNKLRKVIDKEYKRILIS